MDNPFGLNDEELETFFDNMRTATFMIHAMDNVEEFVAEDLVDLIYHQYSVLRDETRPLVVKSIKEIADGIGFRLMVYFYHLLKDQNAGVNVREKYPDFLAMKEVCESSRRPKLEDPSVNPYDFVSDEIWQEMTEDENRDAIAFTYWFELRAAEFIHVIQEAILPEYEEIYELNADEWTVYNFILRDEYDDFRWACEEMETFIDGGYEEEDLDCFRDKYDTLTNDEKMKIINIRSKRNDEQIRSLDQIVPYSGLEFKSFQEYLETLSIV